ncbi:MAG TPA: PEP-CTERM sorting domain-containing protein [Phycisphaerae bacterium]|nr:PEP-CTERM sorting domain-containing protein [Phycisphaerae bacterium]
MDLVVLDLTSQWEDPNPGTQGDAIENPYLTISNFSTDVPGWITDGEPGTVGGTSFFAAGAGVAGDSIDTAGTTVLGTFEVTALDPPDFYPLDIYIRRNPNGPLPGGSWPALWGLEGGFYTFDPDADGISNTFSIGTGFAGNDDGSNFSPLTIYVPEPTALLLLATGVLVAIRRNPR